jgi:hypothetical protein
VGRLRKIGTILLFASLANPFSVLLLILLAEAVFGVASGDAWFAFGAFLAFCGLALAGAAITPMFSVIRRMLSVYEVRKVRRAMDRIDAGLRERAAGNLSHPEDDEQGRISLTASRS